MYNYIIDLLKTSQRIFSNSLIIHQVKTKKITTVKEVWIPGLTAPFNNMRTLTGKAQSTNAFFATVNQVFDGSSQLPTTVERAVIKLLSIVQTTKQCSAVVGSTEEPPNIWLTVAKNVFVVWASNLRVRILLKGAVISIDLRILLLRLLLSLCFDWEDISNTRDSVSSDIQTPRISSKNSAARRILVFGYPDETLSLVFDIIIIIIIIINQTLKFPQKTCFQIFTQSSFVD